MLVGTRGAILSVSNAAAAVLADMVTTCVIGRLIHIAGSCAAKEIIRILMNGGIYSHPIGNGQFVR
jgi:hypothetical protein